MKGFKYKRHWRDVDVDALARRRSLHTQLSAWRDPENPPPAADRDGHSLNLTAETSCPGCGAGEHESCWCWRKTAA